MDIAFGGDAEFPLLLGGADRPVRIAGVLRSFPSLDPLDEMIIVVDGPTLDALQYIERGRASTSFDEWWLAVDDGASDDIAARLDAAPFNSNQIQTRVERTRDLRTDPVALGTLGALTLGFVAAIVFAIVGFVSSAVVGARERMTEFALLRAIGLSSRQLAGWLLIENGFLVVLSLLGGTLLGFLLSWLILPMITVNREAEQVFPSLIVVIPWRTILLLEAAILLLLLVVSAVLAVVLRRIGLGQALRIGEE
ncbi:MAG: FtsX-like permease family protein [Thermomicrobiales bacterium]